MNETLLQRLQKFSQRAKVIHILLIVFPTVLTTTVGIVSLSLYEGYKDVIFGVLTIVFAIAVMTGAIITLFINRKTTRLARRQTAFLANVTHELRSPLAVIKLHAQTLSDERFKENHEMCLSYILDATNHLDHLIQQVLQWKRIASKTEIIEQHPTPGNTPATSAIHKFLSVHKNMEKHLKTELLEDPPEVMLDTGAMARAIYNLLDNAYKYTGENKKISVRTSIVEGKKDKKFFLYRIHDNGIGIDPEDLKHIFDEFYRVSDKLKGAAGIGLGLGIVKSITEAHGGTVQVESVVGEGTAFTLRIPLTVSQ